MGDAEGSRPREEDGKRELPIDFFELEFLSNTPDPRQRDRTLPEIETDPK